MLPAARDILAQKCAEGTRLAWLHCLAKTFAVLCGIKDGSSSFKEGCSAVSYSSPFSTLFQ